jgi:hypothetical protein
MAHLLGLLIFVLLIAAQVAAVIAVHRNERRYRGETNRGGRVHGLPGAA